MIALLLSAAVLLLGLGVALFLFASRDGRSRRVIAGRLRDPADGPMDARLHDDLLAQDTSSVFGLLAGGGRKIETWMDTGSETARLFMQAGWRPAMPRVRFYAVQAGLPIAAAILALLLVLSGRAGSALQAVLLGLMLVIAATLLPRVWLRGRARARQQRIRHEVPMFIHMLILLFEAGLTTRQAIASLIREGGGVVPELQTEMLYTLRQMDAGSETSEAFRQLSEALDVAELDAVLSVLRQIDRYGGEIREPLSEALATLEERQVFELREQVNKQSARMTVVMVLFFLPALLIFVAGPALVSVLGALSQ